MEGEKRRNGREVSVHGAGRVQGAGHPRSCKPAAACPGSALCYEPAFLVGKAKTALIR